MSKSIKGDFCQAQGFCEEAGSYVQEESDLSPRRPAVEMCDACGSPRQVIAPPHLIEPINNALRLDRLKEYGYTREVRLTPIDWACLDALQQARSICDRPDPQEQRDNEFRASATAYAARLRSKK